MSSMSSMCRQHRKQWLNNESINTRINKILVLIRYLESLPIRSYTYTLKQHPEHKNIRKYTKKNS